MWASTCDLVERKMYDLAMLTNERVRVVYNGRDLKIRSFKQYTDLIMGDGRKIFLSSAASSTSRKGKKRKLNEAEGSPSPVSPGVDAGPLSPSSPSSAKGEDPTGPVPKPASQAVAWQIAVRFNPEGFKQISFVNGLRTAEGGTHVEHVKNKITEYLVRACDRRRGSAKAAHLQPKFFWDKLFLIVNATVSNPTFSSQTKERLTSPSSAFKAYAVLSDDDDFLNKLASSEIVTAALETALIQEQTRITAKDARNKKTRTLRGIPKLDDANLAGTAKSTRCTLFLTEGDSAKATVVSGMAELGRDCYGVFPLKGKLLNVRTASDKQVSDNVEICRIKQILGLKVGKQYTELGQLRYGSVCIAADADCDGIHIKGLVLNFIHKHWPELIDLGFVTSLITPIVKATHRTRDPVHFYSQEQLSRWLEDAGVVSNGGALAGGWHLKYYKGLGTSTAEEARAIFREFAKHRVRFEMSPAGPEALELAFGKGQAGERKRWLMSSWNGPDGSGGDDDDAPAPSVGTPRYLCPEQMSSLDKRVGIDDFVNQELITFSREDVERSVPHLMDGFKPSQRKIVYTCLKRNFAAAADDAASLARAGVKVVQLAGSVTALACYQHGEQSLHGTITNLAQDFLGSNQVPLLAAIGQFGTRLMGGKDAASPRYISSCLRHTAEVIFRKEDTHILRYLKEDGQTVEPEFYVPVLPMVLLNGGSGIGTGFSSEVPRFELEGVLCNLLRLSRGEIGVDEIVPLNVGFRGFRGSVRRRDDDPTAWEVEGACCLTDGGRAVRVGELPLGTWTTPYKDWLNEQDWVKSVVDGTSEESVDLRVALQNPIESHEEAVRRFNLRKVVRTGNMHLFDAEGRIRRFETPEAILSEWFTTRMTFYEDRRLHRINVCADSLTSLDNRIRFVHEVVSGTIQLNVPRRDMERGLEQKGYAAESEGNKGFGYLFDMRIGAFTQENIAKLEAERAQVAAERDKLETTTPREMYESDLLAVIAKLRPKDGFDKI
jgi:DNA topoisomerase-2